MFEKIISIITDSGYLGVFLLMLGENLFPPIPSEMIMPFAGFAAARGELDIVLVVLVGTAGSVAGALPWYFAGSWLGPRRLACLADRHGRWLTISASDVDKATRWFARHGGKTVFFGRIIPAIRTLISVPAGVMSMSPYRFLAYSTAGSALWTAMLAGAGYLLEAQYATVARYLDPVSRGILGLMVAAYLYRLVRRSVADRNRGR